MAIVPSGRSLSGRSGNTSVNSASNIPPVHSGAMTCKQKGMIPQGVSKVLQSYSALLKAQSMLQLHVPTKLDIFGVELEWKHFLGNRHVVTH